MIIRYLIILFFVSSLSIKKELGTLYLLETELSEIRLSDYFSGENLRYSLVDQNSTSDLATIQSKYEFDLVSFLPYPNSRKFQPFEKFTAWTFDSNQIIVWFNENQIVLYSISLITEKATEMWDLKIESQYQNLQIQETVYFEKLQYLLIWVKQQEYIGNNFVWRNDFYVMDVNDLSNPKMPIWANFSEPTYSSKIVLPYLENTGYFPIYCEFENDPSKANSLYIYFLIEILDQPILAQTISKYYSFFLPQKLSIIGTFLEYGKLNVLDANYGLIIFKHSFDVPFIEALTEDLRHLGNLHSIGALSSKKTFIFSDIGVSLYIKHIGQESGLRFHIKNNQNLNWINIQESSDFYFIQSHDSLSVVNKNAASPEVMFSIDFKNLGNVEPINSQLLFFSSWYLGLYCARFEKDGLRVYKVSIKEWSLKVSGNCTSLIKVKATDHSESWITSDLHVISVKKRSKEIFLSEKSSRDYSESYAIYDNKADFILDVNSYFLGPNLKFEYKFPKSKQFNFEVSPISKFTLFKNLTLPEEIEDFAHYSLDLWIYYYKDRIYIENISNPDINFTISVANPVKAVTDTNDLTFIYRKSHMGAYMVSVWSIHSSSIIHEFETGMECLLFALGEDCIICGNREKIESFMFFGNRSKKIGTLTQTELENDFHWSAENLMAKFNNNIKLFIYLLDQNQGVLAVNPTQLGELSSILKFKSQGIKFIVGSDLFIGLVYDEKIDIYRGPWIYLKTILIEPHLKIVNYFARNYLIYLHTEDRIYIYDINQPSYSALYYTAEMKISDNFSYSNYKLDLANFHSEIKEKYVEIYRVNCQQNLLYFSQCMLENKIIISVSDWKEIREASYNMNFSVIAHNEENQLERSFPITIVVENLWPNNEKWKINSNIPYNENYIFDLSEVFFGQDIEKSVNVNGNYLSNTDKSFLPVLLPQRIEKVGETNNLNGNIIFDHIAIPQAGIVVITSDFGFIIKNINGFSNETLLIPIQEELQNLVCKQIESSLTLKGTKALIVTICTYQNSNTAFYSDLVEKINAVIFWEFDYKNLSFTQSKLFPIPAEINLLRLAPLDENNFEIMVFAECFNLNHPFSDLWRLRGNWIEGSVNLYNIEKINVLSLGLEKFCIALIDYNIKDTETVYWYLSDIAYGIRVIETHTSLPSTAIGGLKSNEPKIVLSMGICGNLLYVSDGDLKMKSYQIENYININQEKYTEYFSSSNSGSAKPGSIICSEDGRYVAFQSFQPYKDLSLSIFDVKANANSNYIGKFAYNQSDFVESASIQFIDNSTITMITSHTYRSYKINEDYLIFPEMNESEYRQMIEKWGTTEFSMFITAVNENNAMNTSVIVFKREPKSLPSNLRGKNSFLIGIISALIIISMLGFYFIKRIQNSKIKNPFEVISTQSTYEDSKLSKEINV